MKISKLPLMFVWLIISLPALNCSCDEEDDSDNDEVNREELWYEKYEQCMQVVDDCCSLTSDEYTYELMKLICRTITEDLDIDPTIPCVENVFDDFFDCFCETCYTDQIEFADNCASPLEEAINECAE